MQYKNSKKIMIDQRKLETLFRIGCPDNLIIELLKTRTFTPTGDSLIDDNLESLLDYKYFVNNGWGGKRNGAGRKPQKTSKNNHLENQVENQVDNQDANQDIIKSVDKDIDNIKNKFNINSIIYVNGQYFDEFPPESIPLLKKHWSLDELEDIRKKMAFKPEHQTTVAQMLVEYPPKPKKKLYGEQQKVKLSDEEYTKLQVLYGNRLDLGIQKLDTYLAQSIKNEKKYTNHYAVMRRNNWVYNETFKEDYLPPEPEIADKSKFVRAKPL